MRRRSRTETKLGKEEKGDELNLNFEFGIGGGGEG